MDPVVPLLLAPFNVKLHHLTPNAMVQLSKFLWAVRTFGGEVLVDAFCRLFELQCQGRKIVEEGEVEPSEAQNACCTFVPWKNNKKAKLQRIELSTAHKNKWEDDWVRYWFYAKVKFLKPESPSEVYYPLAADIELFEHTYQPGFNRLAPGFNSYVGAFTTASRACGGRDLVEEFVAAKIWPLSPGWYPFELRK